jgi:hypothetical protein
VVGEVPVPGELALEAGVCPVAAARIGQHIHLGVVEVFGLEAGAARGACREEHWVQREPEQGDDLWLLFFDETAYACRSGAALRHGQFGGGRRGAHYGRDETDPVVQQPVFLAWLELDRRQTGLVEQAPERVARRRERVLDAGRSARRVDRDDQQSQAGRDQITKRRSLPVGVGAHPKHPDASPLDKRMIVLIH